VRCLLISPSFIETTSLLGVLEDLGVESVVTTRLGAGAVLATADMTEVDFAVAVCATSTGGGLSRGMAAVLVEVGIALGRSLPTLILAEGSGLVPPALLSLPSATVGLIDRDSLRLHLGLFIAGLDQRDDQGAALDTVRGPLSSATLSKFQQRLAETRSAKSRPNLLEDLVFDVLAAAGATAERVQGPDRGADGAFLVPGEESNLGYVLVEVKSSALMRPDEINRAQLQLQDAVLRRNGGLGLLLVDMPPNQLQSLQITPLIVVLSIDGFVSELGSRTLGAVMLDARNDAVHRF
jgi:hypothetical protein